MLRYGEGLQTYEIDQGEGTGVCPGFLKGGGPISLGSLKKGHQILKGGGGPMV